MHEDCTFQFCILLKTNCCFSVQSTIGQSVLQNMQLYRVQNMYRVLSIQTASASSSGIAMATTTPLLYFRYCGSGVVVYVLTYLVSLQVTIIVSFQFCYKACLKFYSCPCVDELISTVVLPPADMYCKQKDCQHCLKACLRV